VWGYSAPDFVRVAEAYGIHSSSVSRPEEMESGLKKLWENADQPYLLEVKIDIHTNVYPKMMFGQPLTRMEP
jgi:acetolactate synthase I/II/III large subunit